MTTEEKAKAYDEALENARKQRDAYQKELSKTDKNSQLADLFRAGISAVEMIFPQLAESEDERIRKFLIEILSHGSWRKEWPFSPNEVVAWLEKQKYDRMQPVYDNLDSFESALAKAWRAYNDSGARTVDGCEDDYVECAHAKGFREGYLFGLEKQKESTMPSSTELIEMWDAEKEMLKKKDFRDDAWRLAYNAFMDGFARGTCIKFEKQKPVEHGAKGRRGRIGTTPEHIRKKAENFLSKMEPPYDADDICSAYETGAMENANPSWSEEDEKIREELYEYFRQLQFMSDREFSPSLSIDEILSWLKSLRPSWRPSAQELGALKTAVSVLTEERTFPKAAAQIQKIIDVFDGKELRKDWKPSGEQMEVLVYCKPLFCDPTSKKILESLINDLNKLM